MPAYYGGVAQRTDPKFLIDRLIKNGYSRMQAAAIVGNLQRESGLVSNNVNKDEGAYGLMQWRDSRFADLQKFAASKGVPWTDPGAQADFIAHEMGGKERKSAQGFLRARTIDEASAALHPVIRYSDKSGPERAMYARNFFGAADAAPETAAALPVNAPQQPAGAQPAVSRETPYRSAYATEDRPVRGLRGGIASLGGIGEAYFDRQRRQQPAVGGATAQPSGLALLGGLGGAAQSSVPPGQSPVSRVDLAAQIAGAQDPRLTTRYTEPATGNQMLTGAPGRYEQGDVLNLGQPAAMPPGAPEPPRFPGGIPQPRPRPMTGPGMMQGDPLDPLRTVAELGGLVDPMRYDYG